MKRLAEFVAENPGALVAGVYYLRREGQRPRCLFPVERLGTLPDAHLAAELGCSQSAVAARRRRLDIPAFRPIRRLWTPLSTLPDVLRSGTANVVAEKLGVSVGYVNTLRQRYNQNAALDVRVLLAARAFGFSTIARLAAAAHCGRTRATESVQRLAEAGKLAHMDGEWVAT